MNCTQNFKNGKDFFFPQPEDIDAYSKKVKKGRITPTISACPVCNTIPEHFKRHDTRKRQFYVLVEQIVQIVCCLLVRWRCPACNKRILQYPDFALPYKRYTLQTILDYSGRYLENDSASYESVIRQCPIGYREYPTDERQLAKPTLWRWIGSLGMSTLLRQAQHLILQADPACAVSRNLAMLTVPARKYTTFTRKNLLILCRKILHVESAFRNLFGISIFPNLATASGFS